MSDQPSNDRVCPICNQANACGVAGGRDQGGTCWCNQEVIPDEVIQLLINTGLGAACLCRTCLVRLAQEANSGMDLAQSLARLRAETSPPLELLDGDYYLDSLGRMVFTEQYLLRRGFCCGNGCRHCPYPAD